MASQPRMALLGRDAEVWEVRAALEGASTKGEVVVVRGPAGTGKTAVLEAARSAVAGATTKVARLDLTADGCPPGFETVTQAVSELVSRLLGEAGAQRIGAVRRSQARALRDPRHQHRLLLDLRDALRAATRIRPLALLLDDMDAVPVETGVVLGQLLRALRPDMVSVVMAVRSPYLQGTESCPLAGAADRVIELGPLPREHVESLIHRHLGKPVEPALLAALHRSLGSLAGNPRAVLELVDALRDRGGLPVVDGHVCLGVPESEVRLPQDCGELARVAGLGPVPPFQGDTLLKAAAMLARLDGAGQVMLDDVPRLAEALGQSTADVGRVLDRLVEERVVEVGEEHRLRFSVPAFASTLRDMDLECDPAPLHAEIVRSAVDRVGAEAAGTLEPRLADHVRAAGLLLDTASSVGLLLAAARSDPCPRRGHSVSARRAALRLMSPRDERFTGVVRETIDTMLRHGDHTGLLELDDLMVSFDRPRGLPVTGPAPAETTALWTGLLAPASAFAAVHEERLAGDPDDPWPAAVTAVPWAAQLLSIARWQGDPPVPHAPRDARDDGGEPVADSDPPTAVPPGGPLPDPAEIRLLAAAAGPRATFEAALHAVQARRAAGGLHPVTEPERIREAAGLGDCPTAFEVLLGERYGGPGAATAGLYQALVREYLTGSWDTALSLARQIESWPGRGHRVRDLARALAADICCWRNEPARAIAWLDGVAQTDGTPALVRWVRCGVRYWTGQSDQALEQGWQDYRTLWRQGRYAGLERLLLRLQWVAAQQGGSDAYRARVLEAIERLYQETGSRASREALLLARGAYRQDESSVTRGLRLLRHRGDQFIQLHASLTLAGMSADEPWLAETVDIANRLSARRIRQLAAETAQDLGLPLPRRRAARPALTRPELGVIDMVVSGATNRQIASRLAVSEKTVETHLRRIFELTGCRSRVELAAAWLDGSLSRFAPLAASDPVQ